MKIQDSSLGMGILTKNAISKPEKILGDSFGQELAQAVNKKDEQKLYQSCQDLESVFLNKVFESMRGSIPQGGLMEKSFATDTFEGMLYEEYSKQISKKGSIGIADILYKQLSAQIDQKASDKKGTIDAAKWEIQKYAPRKYRWNGRYKKWPEPIVISSCFVFFHYTKKPCTI